MVYQFVLAGVVAGLCAFPLHAQSEPYGTLLEAVAEGDGGICRRMVVEQMIERWSGPSVADAFASVEEIMADVQGGPDFDAAGCNREYRFQVLDCASVDDPTLSHIVPRGVQAATVPERVALAHACISRVEAAGLQP